MSVYKPAKSRFYHYDFQWKGARLHGSTGCESRRKAEQFERHRREEAALGLSADARELTLDMAAGRWWEEVGRHLATHKAVERRIAQLLTLIGPNRAIGAITTPVVLDAMTARRRQTFTRARKKRGARHYPVSNRTVNLDVIDTLRPILKRARKAWDVRGLPEIDWRELRLAEPRPKPREFAGDDLDQVLALVRPHWHDFIRFGARYGPRLEEMFFPPAALDVEDKDDARVTLRERKNGDDHVIPLLPADAAMLAARKSRAEAAKLTTIWFRVLKGGRLKALTYSGAESALRRAMTKSGLRAAKGLKGAHDLRRNSGMKILRATGNLRVTQRLLGHVSIQSTLVYAHAIEADVKAGLEAALSRNSPEAAAEVSEEAQPDQAARAS